MARNRWYQAGTITDANYKDYKAFLANTPAEAECLPYILEQAARRVSLNLNLEKTNFIGFKMVQSH